MAPRPRKPGGAVPIPLDERAILAVAERANANSTAIRTLRCRTVAQGRLHQLNYIRDLPPHAVMEDQPEGILGDSLAPNASESLLAALGSCLSVGIHANALARNIPIRSLKLDLEADVNMAAAWGSGDLNPKALGFEAIRISVGLDADASRKVLAELVRHTVLWSPVANTLHNPVHLDVALTPGPSGV